MGSRGSASAAAPSTAGQSAAAPSASAARAGHRRHKPAKHKPKPHAKHRHHPIRKKRKKAHPTGHVPARPIAKPAPGPVTAPPAASVPPAGNAPPPAFSEPTTVAHMRRLLWRAGFGPAPGQAEALAGQPLQQVVYSLTRPSGRGDARPAPRRSTPAAIRSRRPTPGATTTAGGSIA